MEDDTIHITGDDVPESGHQIMNRPEYDAPEQNLYVQTNHVFGGDRPLAEPTATETHFVDNAYLGLPDPGSSWLAQASVESPSVSPTWNGGFGLTQEETNQLLSSLQESVPDVGRLFDGSIGTFGWT